MRNRSFAALDLVGLPKLDAPSLVALSQALDAAAPEKGEDKKPFRSTLPEPVQDALGDIAETRATLQTEMERELPPPPGARDADRLEDNTVLAVIEILGGWARLAGQIPQGDVAARLFRRLFGEGSTAFINYPVKKEWAVVDGKLKLIADEKLEDDLKKLGALPALACLHEVHKAYGEAIGATKAPPPVESPQLRDKREELADAVRTYVVRVVGLRDKKKPETIALADRLLQPLIEWQSPEPTAKGAAPKDPATPKETAAPKDA